MGEKEIVQEQTETASALDALWQGRTPDIPDLAELDAHACDLEAQAANARMAYNWADVRDWRELRDVEELETSARDARAKHTGAMDRLKKEA
jgi:hypothetical protein